MATNLTVPTEGPCAGHPCDNCQTCRRGRCCRRDDPDYRLPGLGEWEGPIFGELGRVNTDGEVAECHFCGGWFRAVGIHAWHAHDLTADEYRAIVGLNRQHALLAPATRQRYVDVQRRLLAADPTRGAAGAARLAAAQARTTPEQAAAWGALPSRLESMRDRNRLGVDDPAWVERTCRVCGQPFLARPHAKTRQACCGRAECRARHAQERQQRRTTGNTDPRAHLTAEQVIEVRRRYAAGGVSYRQLARDYGVSRSVIIFAIRRRTWWWLPDGTAAEQASP